VPAGLPAFLFAATLSGYFSSNMSGSKSILVSAVEIGSGIEFLAARGSAKIVAA
jgi:hypothetical protein